MSIFNRFKKDPIDLSEDEIKDLIKIRALRNKVRHIIKVLIYVFTIEIFLIYYFLKAIQFVHDINYLPVSIALGALLVAVGFLSAIIVFFVGIDWLTDPSLLSNQWKKFIIWYEKFKRFIKLFIKSFIYKDKKGQL